MRQSPPNVARMPVTRRQELARQKPADRGASAPYPAFRFRSWKMKPSMFINNWAASMVVIPAWS